jgi:hypothetical protein
VRVADGNEVHARGMELVTDLGGDPHITDALQSLMATIGQDPAMQAALLRMMQAHPDATPDQIGELFSEQIQQTFARPEVSAVWNESFGQLTARFEHEPAFAAIEADLTARVATRYNDAEVTRRWNKRLLELSNGSAPARDQATELLLSHMLSDERLDKIGVDLLANPTLRAETSAALAKLIAAKPVVQELHQASVTLLGDRTVRAAIIDLFHQLANDQPDPDAMKHALDTILSSPPMLDALRGLIRISTTDPDVRGIFAVWLEHVGSDPELRTTFDKLLFDW